jgi:hypothetical protein
MMAFFQWALGAGFWRFAGVVVLLSVVAHACVAAVAVIAQVIVAFRRPA